MSKCHFSTAIDSGDVAPSSVRRISPKPNMENKGNNKITELRTILQRESQNS
jgi:hypothetical protein